MLDALILGQGLAGSLLAWTLLERGWDLAVVDDGHRSSASRVAAGLINPVTGRRLARTPDLERLLPAAHALYGRLPEELDLRPPLHSLPMRRLFRSAEEVRHWDRRRRDPPYRPYLEERLPPGAIGCGVADPLGSGPQRGTGFLDTEAVLDAVGTALRAQGRLHRMEVQPFDIRPREGYVECRGLHAARAILCEGHRAMDGPWFGWLPFEPAKGEILTLESRSAVPPLILNAGRWALPLGGGRLRLGATYDRTTRDQEPSEAGREELLRDLDGLVRLDERRLVAHRAGIRPGTRDHAPFVGRHLRHPQLWVFNGFGSKGALLIPAHAADLADHMAKGVPLPERSDIRRFAELAG